MEILRPKRVMEATRKKAERDAEVAMKILQARDNLEQGSFYHGSVPALTLHRKIYPCSLLF